METVNNNKRVRKKKMNFLPTARRRFGPNTDRHCKPPFDSEDWQKIASSLPWRAESASTNQQHDYDRHWNFFLSLFSPLAAVVLVLMMIQLPLFFFLVFLFGSYDG